MTATLEIELRSVGRSPVVVPRVALGCGNFGGVGSAPEFFGRGMTEEQAFELMDAAWELGITHFDTADAYGGGRSEQAIGRWIRSRGVTPLLTTKTFHPMAQGADRGLAPERIERQLQESLGRLGVERVDLYLAHDYDADVPLADTFAAFEELQRAGKVRAHGVSNFDAPQLSAARRAGPPAAVQNAYSLLERRDQAEVLPLCEESHVAYLAFSPLSGGWLTGKYRRGEPYPEGSRMTQRPQPYHGLEREETFAALDRLRAYARGHGASLAGLALAWLLADRRVAQIVVGPGRPQHLGPVSEALSTPLSALQQGQVTRLVSP
jgi:aryl-alcohol dehydrogenase-like predicted oxidoreductase